jgi:hypothetical protein
MNEWKGGWMDGRTWMAALRPERTYFGGTVKESSISELRIEQMIKKLIVWLY